MIPIQDKGESRELFEWVKLSDGFPEDIRQPNGTPHLIVLRHQFPEWYYTFKIMTPNQIADDFKCQNLKNWEWAKPIQSSLKEDNLFDFCHFLGKEGYKINGYDDGQLKVVIENFFSQPSLTPKSIRDSEESKNKIMKIHYVAGFCFNYSRTKVALILKNKPFWQKGKYNGIGGKVEENETPVDAMQREFKEEAGVDIWAWNEFLTYEGEDYVVHFFKAFSAGIDGVKTVTDEEVRVFDIGEVSGLPVIPNLKWLIPLALDKNVIECSASEFKSASLKPNKLSE